MALTKEDLQAISELIQASEQRTMEHIAASERRTTAYIENHVESDIHKIADGHLMLSEKLDRIQSDIDDIHETLTAHELYILHRESRAKEN